MPCHKELAQQRIEVKVYSLGDSCSQQRSLQALKEGCPSGLLNQLRKARHTRLIDEPAEPAVSMAMKGSHLQQEHCRVQGDVVRTSAISSIVPFLLRGAEPDALFLLLVACSVDMVMSGYVVVSAAMPAAAPDTPSTTAGDTIFQFSCKVQLGMLNGRHDAPDPAHRPFDTDKQKKGPKYLAAALQEQSLLRV